MKTKTSGDCRCSSKGWKKYRGACFCCHFYHCSPKPFLYYTKTFLLTI